MEYAAARQAMVDCQVRPNDVTNAALLSALEVTPKERFLPSDQRTGAYVEKEIAYAPGRAYAIARDFAKLVQAMNIRQGDLVLDVASGMGYATAVLARLADMVVAVESDEALAADAEKALTDLDVANAAVIAGDLLKGAAGQGPFDVIHVGGVIEQAPQALLALLKEGGRLGAFVKEDGVVSGVVYHKTGDAIAIKRHFTSCSRVMLPGFAKTPEFTF